MALIVTIQFDVGMICMDLIPILCICHAFSAVAIMISHTPKTQESDMNGLSDVRLTLKGRELESGAGLRLSGVPAPRGMRQRWHCFIRRLTTRRDLLRLSDAQLQDIGLSREQARREATLPFWKL